MKKKKKKKKGRGIIGMPTPVGETSSRTGRAVERACLREEKKSRNFEKTSCTFARQKKR